MQHIYSNLYEGLITVIRSARRVVSLQREEAITFKDGSFASTFLSSCIILIPNNKAKIRMLENSSSDGSHSSDLRSAHPSETKAHLPLSLGRGMPGRWGKAWALRAHRTLGRRLLAPGWSPQWAQSKEHGGDGQQAQQPNTSCFPVVYVSPAVRRFTSCTLFGISWRTQLCYLICRKMFAQKWWVKLNLHWSVNEITWLTRVFWNISGCLGKHKTHSTIITKYNQNTQANTNPLSPLPATRINNLFVAYERIWGKC